MIQFHSSFHRVRREIHVTYLELICNGIFLVCEGQNWRTCTPVHSLGCKWVVGCKPWVLIEWELHHLYIIQNNLTPNLFTGTVKKMERKKIRNKNLWSGTYSSNSCAPVLRMTLKALQPQVTVIDITWACFCDLLGNVSHRKKKKS